MRSSVAALLPTAAVVLAGSCRQVEVIDLPDPDDGVPVIALSADELSGAAAIALAES